MATIPLEDSFSDIVGKAQRGLKLSDEALAQNAGTTVSDLQRVKSGDFDEPVLRKLAPALNLKTEALLELGKKAWFPAPITLPGLAQFNTTFEDMTVNSFVVFDAKTKEAVAFDTGADTTPMLDFAKENGLLIKLILITHTHIDHIVDLAKLKKETGAPAYVCELEEFADAQPFAAGKTFSVGALKIESRQTSGHAKGGITFVVSGLQKPVAIVGDALFCCSMGGGMISYEEALRTNRQNIFTLPDDTILCPGHGPLTTLGEQKEHNPFYPEFKN